MTFSYILHTENRPPGVVPLKARYMGKDIIRLAEYYRIPLNSPAVSIVVDMYIYIYLFAIH